MNKGKMRPVVVAVMLLAAAAMLAAVWIMTESSRPAESSAEKVYISEAMSGNTLCAPASDGAFYDWAELHNPGSVPVSLSGLFLTDNEKQPHKYPLSGIELEPDGYAVIYLSGESSKADGEYFAPMKLSSDGEKLFIFNSDGTLVDQMNVPKLGLNIACAVAESADGKREYFYTAEPTPGRANDTEMVSDPAELTMREYSVCINEYVTGNTTGLRTRGGGRLPWAELYNDSDEKISLTGFGLTDDRSEKMKWCFPEGAEIAPRGYIVVFFGQEEGELCADFGISEADGALSLFSPQGMLCSSVPLIALADDTSWGVDSAGNEAVFVTPTPGAVNSGKTVRTGERAVAELSSDIIINEAAAVTSGDGDWLELYNKGAKAVSLKGFTLGEEPDEPLYTFKNAVLEPDSYLVVFCSEDKEDSPEAPAAPFTLGAGGNTIYLCGADGNVLDRFETGMQTVGTSSGRVNGDTTTRRFFAQPTPGAENGEGVSGFAKKPSASVGGGFYDKEVTVTLSAGSGEYITYTTDGRDPTAGSPKYSGEISIDKTTVLKAAAFADDKIMSGVMCETYFIGCGHSIAAVSLSGEPLKFNLGEGMLNNSDSEEECACRVEFFDESGLKAVEFPAGAAIFGTDSRKNPQKNIKLLLGEKYGCARVDYPFFGSRSVSEFGSLVLRPSGEDQVRSKVRDELIACIMRGRCEVDLMEYRPCALYVNGQYWGLYYLRERLDSEYIGHKYGLRKGAYDMIKGYVVAQEGNNEAWLEIQKFARDNDMTDPKNYEYVCSQVDIDSLCEFWIIETYFGNVDTGTGNIRFWKAYEDGKWRWMLYDMDWAFTKETWRQNLITRKLLTREQGNDLIFNLFKNDDFRDRFISLYCYHLNTTFAPKRTTEMLDGLISDISGEMPRQFDRWGFPSQGDWNAQTEYIRACLEERPEMMKEQLISAFGLSEAQLNRYLRENTERPE